MIKIEDQRCATVLDTCLVGTAFMYKGEVYIKAKATASKGVGFTECFNLNTFECMQIESNALVYTQFIIMSP